MENIEKVENKIRIPYYYALFENANEHKLVIECNSHPFIFLKIEKELGRIWICSFWKEITEDEFNYSILLKD